MSFTIQQATRTGVKPLVGFYGRSGSGKTMSALLFARGLVGPSGRVVLIDSENGRGSIFADLIPGGYSVLNLDAPFSPDRYQEAIAEAEKSADVIAIDSLTHEWSGEAGVLDWAEQELERMGGGDNNKMRSWIKPKMAHKMMIQRLLRTKCALICCLRGEEKTHIVSPSKQIGDPMLYPPTPSGKGKVVTDDFSSPIFDQRFIFEMLLNFETVARNGVGGYVIPRKITHPSIAALLPKENEQISIAHGQKLAAWCASPGGTNVGGEVAGGVALKSPAGGAKPASVVAPAADIKKLKAELWNITKEQHGGKVGKLNIWLLDQGIIGDQETLEEMGVTRLQEVISKTKEKIK
jgi:hypothetical protein